MLDTTTRDKQDAWTGTIAFLLLRPSPWPGEVGRLAIGRDMPSGPMLERMAALLGAEPDAVERVPVNTEAGPGWMFLDRHAYRRKADRNEAATAYYRRGHAFRQGIWIAGNAILTARSAPP